MEEEKPCRPSASISTCKMYKGVPFFLGFEESRFKVRSMSDQ